jgi:uncharacterized membrane protein
MSDELGELKKEFELERMILFSDAVFAIAITLLIIEIKFPEIEKGMSSHEILLAFKPVVIRFLGFILSFLIIGIMWARHLKIFSYINTYNDGVIVRNLVFLFFIVCFPFTASGLTEHVRPSFLLPFLIYLINVSFVWTAQYFLCAYIFNKKSNLTDLVLKMKKSYFLMQSKYMSIGFFIAVAVTVILQLILGPGSIYSYYGFLATLFFVAIMRKRLKKYKPAKKDKPSIILEPSE